MIPVMRTCTHIQQTNLSVNYCTLTRPSLHRQSISSQFTQTNGYQRWKPEKVDPLLKIHLEGPPKRKAKKHYTDFKPFLKGVVLKTLVKKPKKPNSANRKCVLVRLSTGRECIAYIPGEGHNLQEHNIVLVRGGRLQDVPGVKHKCVRGKFDLPHVIKPGT